MLFYCAVILILVAGFRGIGIDKDYTTYLNSYSLVKSPVDYFINYNEWSFLEPFYYLIPSIFKILIPGFYATPIFFLFACFGIFAKFYGINKMSTSKSMSLVIYFSFFFFLHEMTQIRVGIASGGLLACSYFYYHKAWLHFFIVLLVSMCFQYTGILIVVVLLLNKNKFNVYINISILIISYALLLLRINVIDEFIFRLNLPFTEKLLLTLKSLTFKENQINPFNIPYILNLVLQFWLFVNYKKIQVATKYGILLLKVQLLSFVFFGIFSSVAVVAFRLYEFFGVASLITTTYFLFTLKNQIIGKIILILYSLLLLINLLHLTKLILPYESIFSQN